MHGLVRRGLWDWKGKTTGKQCNFSLFVLFYRLNVVKRVSSHCPEEKILKEIHRLMMKDSEEARHGSVPRFTDTVMYGHLLGFAGNVLT